MFQKRGSLQELRILPQGVRKLSKTSLKEDAPKVPPPPEKSLKAAKSKPNSLFSPGFTLGRAPIRAAPPPYTPSIVSASEPRDFFPLPSSEYSSANINFCSVAERWLDAMAAPLGGHDIIDSRILNHIPTLYLFVTETRLKDFMLTNRPSKFVFLLVILAILQALIPALEIPLDAMAQILYVSFTWHENAHVQLRPVPMLLTHLVSSARHLLPYAWLGLDKFAIPSLLMLVITFGLFMCPRNLRRPQAPGSDRSPTETFGTVVETFLCPQVGPLVELTGVAVQAERAKRYLCEANDSDTYGLLKLGFASGLLLFGTSMFSRTLAELGFRLTWWLLTIKTLLVLEGLRTSAPNAESEAHHVLLVWSIRLILHAFETAHVPLVGVIGSTAIASIPMYYPAVTVAVLALLYREDVRDIKCGIADEHELYHPRRCHSAEI